MTTSPARRWLWVALAITGCTAVAVVGVVLLRPDPAPERAPFRGYSLVKSGGIAGVRHHIQVSADGTVLYVDEQPVAGRLPQRNMNRLSALLSDRDLAKEDGGPRPGTQCADAFRWTLTVGRTKASKEDCGSGGDTPVLDEIIDLTAKSDLERLPADAPKFRGLKATYHRLWRNEAATVHIDGDGDTRVKKKGEQERRGRVEPGTLDALRLLYAEPLERPKTAGGVSCVPEQIPAYKITPTGRPTVDASVCGRLTDYRWTARLAIIRAEIDG